MKGDIIAGLVPKSDAAAQAWWSASAAEASVRLGVDQQAGLSVDEARQRLARSGPNLLAEEKAETILDMLIEELHEPMIMLLVATGILYAIWGGLTDTLTIFAVIFILLMSEVLNERRAEQAITKLSELAEPTAVVRRGGNYLDVATEDVVPGDIIMLETGRRVPADARLLESYGLAVDESALTGESVATEKDTALALPATTALAERRNSVFSGTFVTRGRGSAVVVATGMNTELGRVAGLAREVEAPPTQLENLMNSLVKPMALLAIGFSVAIPLLGWVVSGQSPRQMFLTGLALAFSVIPEELPIILTMVLALGAYRLSQKHAIVKRLQAVESLGSVTVIATDKTGTLTENRLRVEQMYPVDMTSEILRIAALCNDAGAGNADPLDTALVRAAEEGGVQPALLRQTYSLHNEFTFDNTRKRMSTVYEHAGAFSVLVKGAPEAVLAQCSAQSAAGARMSITDDARARILATAAQMADQALRVVAFAEKDATAAGLSQAQAESDLTFVGLAGLVDPPRVEVKQAIAECRAAGIRPIIITGDHPLTTKAVAAAVGLDGGSEVLTGADLDKLSDEQLQQTVGRVALYARTTPEHKLRIVKALQARHELVAVTGDGINDAPALAAADIGVAMGVTGTQVAREAAGIILADDNFATIVRAVEQGRVVFANLKKGVRYYLACKVALVLAMLLPVLLGVPVPFAPIQIILLELFMDLAASATFVAEPAESDLMQQKPRNPQAPFLDRSMLVTVFAAAAGLFAAVSIAYLSTWYATKDLATSQTVAFVTWLLSHVFLALNMRSEREPLVQLGVFSNRLMVVWGAVTIVFILIVTLFAPIQGAVKTAALTGSQWEMIVVVAALATFWIEIAKWLIIRFRQPQIKAA